MNIECRGDGVDEVGIDTVTGASWFESTSLLPADGSGDAAG